MIVNPYNKNLVITKSFKQTQLMKQVLKLLYVSIFSTCQCRPVKARSQFGRAFASLLRKDSEDRLSHQAEGEERSPLLATQRSEEPRTSFKNAEEKDFEFFENSGTVNVEFFSILSATSVKIQERFEGFRRLAVNYSWRPQARAQPPPVGQLAESDGDLRKFDLKKRYSLKKKRLSSTSLVFDRIDFSGITEKKPPVLKPQYILHQLFSYNFQDMAE